MSETQTHKKKKTLKNKRKNRFGKKGVPTQKVDRIFIGNKPPPPEDYSFEEQVPHGLPFGVEIDRESITYNGKTFEKGDPVMFSSKKDGKLIKIGKKVIIVLRNDNNKERRLKIEDFIKYNF
jgi:hypothetical protein